MNSHRLTILSMLAVVGLLLAAGCAGSGPSSGRSAEFDPFGFPDDDTVVTASVERSASEHRRVPTSRSRATDAPEEETTTVMLVQFFTTTNYAEAEQILQRASAALNEPVKLDFETPYYKLKAGPLASREAADKLVIRLRAMGYESAWVVTEQVTAPRKR